MDEIRELVLMKMYCVYDSKGENFGQQPFFYSYRADALRDFEKAANDDKQKMCQHAADFTLFEIGTWDVLAGVVTMYDVKIPLGTALEFKRSNNVKEEVVR